MRYGTVCSGVEAFGPAWKAMGYECAFHAEIAPHPVAVLRHHYPETPNYGDFTTIHTERIDLLAGGTPCQDFSVAGLRKGLAGKRGNLTIEFARLAERLRPRWLVWENVPGVLSADGGRAFGEFLTILAECGYYAAYRVLDAQHFGVPQRRRRVFLVAYFGDWRPAAAVLFEPESLHRHSAPSRKTGQNLAGTLTATTSGSGPASRLELAATGYLQTVGTLAAGYSKNGAPDVDAGLLVFDTKQITSKVNRSRVEPGMPAPTLTRGMDAPTIAHGAAVRRLTPLECERLMGYPGDWTRYGVKPNGTPYTVTDGPRYQMCGNGWATPVANWVGSRVMLVERLINPC